MSEEHEPCQKVIDDLRREVRRLTADHEREVRLLVEQREGVYAELTAMTERANEWARMCREAVAVGTALAGQRDDWQCRTEKAEALVGESQNLATDVDHLKHDLEKAEAACAVYVLCWSAGVKLLKELEGTMLDDDDAEAARGKLRSAVDAVPPGIVGQSILDRLAKDEEIVAKLVDCVDLMDFLGVQEAAKGAENA
jgi:DNA repair exonuclease SbcCD ATPase subunit